MALASMDALGAFSHLQTNLPAWITRVSDLAAHTSAKHAEYTEAYRRHAAFKPRRRKNSSVCSIHTDDFVPIAQRESPNPEAVDAAEAVTTTSATKDTPAPTQQAGRKRGPDETSSIDSSEHCAFVSTRHNVIIEYDGHTQKVLEDLVKEIGSARNHIRRGKMSAMPRTSLRAGLLNRTANFNSATAGGGESPLAGLAAVRSARTGASLVSAAGAGPETTAAKESPFDSTDKQLELAHGLCETAAYQVLRSGDCGTELNGVEEKFKTLLDMANNEVTRLAEEKKQQQQQQRQQQQESQPAEKEESAKPPQTPTAARFARLAAISATPNKPATTTPTTTVAGAIEVDDGSSISAESLDLSAFRASRIRV
ncbi:uncharacterized protein N7459_002968 [Penicillium hispanicum]|uniref:uncharacterized protein n=1 Tax=Penicillium hispanicum TaxID=1080232 RepID=UPI002540C480|nr:uncharacterized protein N7459_002968 [Penicillium hispanicum]KAJ5587203.1 hypothetical protein N7459_002968 [Penicillium hispanicum]